MKLWTFPLSKLSPHKDLYPPARPHHLPKRRHQFETKYVQYYVSQPGTLVLAQTIWIHTYKFTYTHSYLHICVGFLFVWTLNLITSCPMFGILGLMGLCPFSSAASYSWYVTILGQCLTAVVWPTTWSVTTAAWASLSHPHTMASQCIHVETLPQPGLRNFLRPGRQFPSSPFPYVLHYSKISMCEWHCQIWLQTLGVGPLRLLEPH